MEAPTTKVAFAEGCRERLWAPRLVLMAIIVPLGLLIVMLSLPSGPILGGVLVLVYSYYYVCFLAPPGVERVRVMHKTFVAVSLAFCAAVLGGCAGGSMSGGSLLPAARLHSLDSVGGGLPKTNGTMHHLDSVGGGLPKAEGRMHHLDSVGGGLPKKHDGG